MYTYEEINQYSTNTINTLKTLSTFIVEKIEGRLKLSNRLFRKYSFEFTEFLFVWILLFSLY